MTIREIDELVEKIDRMVTRTPENPVTWDTRAWPIRRQMLRELIEDAVKE